MLIIAYLILKLKKNMRRNDQKLNTIQYNTIKYNTIQYNTIKYKHEYYYSGINPVEFRGHLLNAKKRHLECKLDLIIAER